MEQLEQDPRAAASQGQQQQQVKTEKPAKRPPVYEVGKDGHYGMLLALLHMALDELSLGTRLPSWNVCVLMLSFCI